MSLATRCIWCEEGRVHRSRSNGFHERLMKVWTAKRLYRCNRCGWRGWLLPVDEGATAPQGNPNGDSEPDLTELDQTFPGDTTRTRR